MQSFDFSTLSPRDKYKILIGSVVPRPIALVTTVDGEGRINAAPFSFFNALSADPPILALGVENYGDQSPKDTTRNIQLNQEFTVNIVSDALVEAMNVCAVPFAPGFDELTAAGLTAIPGTTVKCPRIGEAPVALECRRMMALSIGQSREIIFGEVLMAHVRDELIDPKAGCDRTHGRAWLCTHARLLRLADTFVAGLDGRAGGWGAILADC